MRRRVAQSAVKSGRKAQTKKSTRKSSGSGKWLQKAEKRMEQKGTKGLFTKKAKRAGMGVQQYANYVLSHKNKFSKKTIEEAVFAKNANKVAKRR